MKRLVFLFLITTCFAKAQKGQISESIFFPNSIVLATTWQQEDVFQSIGFFFILHPKLVLDVRYGFGVKRTIFQRSSFSKTDAAISVNLLDSKKWFVGPSIQFSVLRLSPDLFQPIQKYFISEFGYRVAFGARWKFFQSSYYSLRTMEIVASSQRYFYQAFSANIGCSYEI